MTSGDELVIEFDCTQATEAIHNGRQKKDMPSPIISRLAMRVEHHRSKSLTQHCPPPYQRGGFKLDNLFRVLPKRF